jgi:endonuclease-3 related protein
MATLGEAFASVHSALVERFGVPEPTYQGLDPFEAICAVLLDRTLGPQKSAAALKALRESDLLAPDRLASSDLVEMIDLMAQNGLSVSAAALAPLKRLAAWFVDHHESRIAAIFDPHRSTEWLWGELAGLKGIGAAGADAVLLYALKRPAYPVDRATFRVLVRHGWLEPTATYQEARDLVVDCAASDSGIYDERDLAEANEGLADELMDLAHGMEQVGRRYCRPAAAQCDLCPLVSFLPEGGHRQSDS